VIRVSDERVEVTPGQLRDWAHSHDRAAEACAAARQDSEQTLAAVQSWGPLFHEARRAAIDAVAARDATLAAEQQRHEAMARQLRSAADQFEGMDDTNSSRLTMRAE
jgi:Excreted virulence factor EspC, type VII ESX diderm